MVWVFNWILSPSRTETQLIPSWRLRHTWLAVNSQNDFDNGVTDDNRNSGVIQLVLFMSLSSWDCNSALCPTVYLLPSLLQGQHHGWVPDQLLSRLCTRVMLFCHLIEILTHSFTLDPCFHFAFKLGSQSLSYRVIHFRCFLSFPFCLLPLWPQMLFYQTHVTASFSALPLTVPPCSMLSIPTSYPETGDQGQITRDKDSGTINQDSLWACAGSWQFVIPKILNSHAVID